MEILHHKKSWIYLDCAFAKAQFANAGKPHLFGGCRGPIHSKIICGKAKQLATNR